MCDRNILFFSNYCERSKLLISMFNSENLTRLFYTHNIDNNPSLRSSIKVTPTIIIRGHNVLHSGEAAFVWLASVKRFRINLQMKQMNAKQQQFMDNINQNLSVEKNSLLGYNATEMNCTSDIFSFCGNNVTGEEDNPLPQSYTEYGKIGSDAIFTPPLENGTYDISDKSTCALNELQHKTLHNMLVQERSQQDEIIRNNRDKFLSQPNRQN